MAKEKALKRLAAGWLEVKKGRVNKRLLRREARKEAAKFWGDPRERERNNKKRKKRKGRVIKERKGNFFLTFCMSYFLLIFETEISEWFTFSYLHG